jgi:hypothetical protein
MTFGLQVGLGVQGLSASKAANWRQPASTAGGYVAPEQNHHRLECVPVFVALVPFYLNVSIQSYPHCSISELLARAL